MTTSFDPYHRWLGIRPEEQPADHYRLLGLARFEDDIEVIRDAAERQIAHVRRNTLGANAELAQQLLNELGQAKACLTDHATKAYYDARLDQRRAASQQAVRTAPRPDSRVAVPNADLEAQRRQIVQMYASQQWREADSLLQAMRKRSDPASLLYVEWAEQQLVSLHALLQRKQQAAAYAMRSAHELFGNQEYFDAAQRLLQVDKQLRTAEMNELLDKAMELQEEVDQLITQIEFGLRDRKRAGTLRNIQRLMELKPKDCVARDLYRKFRWQERAGWLGLMVAGALALDHYKKSTPFYEEPLFRKWFAFATLVGLVAFGLTSWGLYRYLRRAEAARHARDVVVVEPEVNQVVTPDATAIVPIDNQQVYEGDALALAPIDDLQVNEGTQLLHKFKLADPSISAGSVLFELVGESHGALLDSQGVFTWTPASGTAGDDVDFVVRVTDNGDPPQSVEQTIRIRVDAKPLEAQCTNSIGMTLKLIPAGEFMMGGEFSGAEMARRFNSKEEYFINVNVHPQHRVQITKPFYMGTTEVTQGQWEAVMGTTPWKGTTGVVKTSFVKEGSDYAATYVHWDDAVEFCRRLGLKDSRSYRLPTEAEWEFACRAGSTTMYSCGDSAASVKDYAWFDENARKVDENYVHRVGQKRPNAFGLFDMHGNVREWCSDWYAEDYYAKSPGSDPIGPTTGSFRVFRGGSWYFGLNTCYSACRNWGPQGFPWEFLEGFRVSSSVPAEPTK